MPEQITACPECKSATINKRADGTYRCRNGHVFNEPITRPRRLGGSALVSKLQRLDPDAVGGNA